MDMEKGMPGEYDHLSTAEISVRLRTLLACFERTGWSSEEHEYGKRLWRALSPRVAVGAHNPVKPKKLRVRDIKAGDVYKENGRVMWTAVEDARVVDGSSAGSLTVRQVHVRVRYPDHGTAVRFWEGADVNYELPGLERP